MVCRSKKKNFGCSDQINWSIGNFYPEIKDTFINPASMCIVSLDAYLSADNKYIFFKFFRHVPDP